MQLRDRSSVGKTAKEGNEESFMHILFAEHKAVDLADQDLGETVLVDDMVDTGNAKLFGHAREGYHMPFEQN